MYRHQGVYRYKCPECHKGFSATTNLKQHMITHFPNGPATVQSEQDGQVSDGQASDGRACQDGQASDGHAGQDGQVSDGH